MSASVEDLESHILEKYNIIQRLGKGAYGVVWRAINKETKEEVAIKKVPASDSRCSTRSATRPTRSAPSER